MRKIYPIGKRMERHRTVRGGEAGLPSAVPEEGAERDRTVLTADAGGVPTLGVELALDASLEDCLSRTLRSAMCPCVQAPAVP